MPALPCMPAAMLVQLILAFNTLCFGFSDAALLFSVAACRESAEALSAAIEREADLRAALAEASSRLEQAAAGAGLLPCAVLWCPIPANYCMIAQPCPAREQRAVAGPARRGSRRVNGGRRASQHRG